LLIIDGSYFKKASKESAQLNGRRIDFARLLRFLVRTIGSEFTHRYWIDSARPDEDNNQFLKVREKKKKKKRLFVSPRRVFVRSFAQVLNSHQIRTEIRPLKNMNVLCRERNCNCVHSANGRTGRAIRREVQAGVDVAIATKILTLACENRLDSVVLLAGDGDFVDAVKYVKETLHKKVFVVGFKDSLSARLMPYAETPHGVIVLDDFADVIAQGATGAIGGAVTSSSGASSGAARPRSPPSDNDFVASLPSVPSAAEMWAMSSSRAAPPQPQPPTVARSASNNEALVKQLFEVGIADEAACRAALQRVNWSMDAALDELFAQNASQAYVQPPTPVVVAAAAPPVVVVAAAAPTVAPAAPSPTREEPTALLLKLQAQKQQQIQQQLQQDDQQRKQDLLLKLLKQDRVDEPESPPPPVKTVAAIKASPSPPQSVSPKSVSPKSSSPRSSVSAASTPADYNDLVLIHLSSLKELQGMGFEIEAAKRALHEAGGDLSTAVNSLLKQST
jgi:uncharacterized LabA/DUF88 family protein